MAAENQTAHNVGAYSSIFIYPFLFNRKQLSSLTSQLIQEDCRWEIDIYNLEEFGIERLSYFYPYVQNFLYPTARLVREMSGEKTPFQQLETSEQLKLLSHESCSRFKFNLNKLGSKNFTLFSHRENYSVFEVSFDKISLLIFPTGVGLLLLDLKLVCNGQQSQPTFEELIRFNNLFRGLKKFHSGRNVGHLRFAYNGSCLEYSVKKFIFWLLGPFTNHFVHESDEIFDDRLLYYAFVAFTGDENEVKSDDPFFCVLRICPLIYLKSSRWYQRRKKIDGNSIAGVEPECPFLR